MDITDRIIKKYKKYRNIKDEYVLNDDEMYLIDEIVKLKSRQREQLLDFANYSESDKISQTTDECVDNYLDSIK